MTKSELANQLRQRQHQHGTVTAAVIDATTDDQIIDSYITCCCCQKKQVSPDRLAYAIKKATSAASFFHICNNISILKNAYPSKHLFILDPYLGNDNEIIETIERCLKENISSEKMQQRLVDYGYPLKEAKAYARILDQRRNQ
jgi:hypothetical protein